MNKFYRWYDNLQEPWRFLVFMGITTPLIGMISLGGFVVAFAGASAIICLFISRVIDKKRL